MEFFLTNHKVVPNKHILSIVDKFCKGPFFGKLLNVHTASDLKLILLESTLRPQVSTKAAESPHIVMPPRTV